MKTSEDFIPAAKQAIRSRMPFEDYLDVIANMSEQDRNRLTQLWRKGGKPTYQLVGELIEATIQAYINSQRELIDEIAEEYLRDYEENAFAESRLPRMIRRGF